MPKPSERILEIYNEIICPPNNSEISSINRHLAICKYLDEEWEEKNTTRCSSSIVMDTYPEMYCCDICKTQWRGDEKTPICKGKNKV